MFSSFMDCQFDWFFCSSILMVYYVSEEYCATVKTAGNRLSTVSAAFFVYRSFFQKRFPQPVVVANTEPLLLTAKYKRWPAIYPVLLWKEEESLLFCLFQSRPD